MVEDREYLSTLAARGRMHYNGDDRREGFVNGDDPVTEHDSAHGGADKPQLNIVLVEPQIPQNTGNIARTCAVTGARLHLVGPMGFAIDDRKLKRAGLDYWHLLDITHYPDYAAFEAAHPDALHTSFGVYCVFLLTLTRCPSQWEEDSQDRTRRSFRSSERSVGSARKQTSRSR